MVCHRLLICVPPGLLFIFVSAWSWTPNFSASTSKKKLVPVDGRSIHGDRQGSRQTDTGYAGRHTKRKGRQACSTQIDVQTGKRMVGQALTEVGRPTGRQTDRET